MAGQIGRSGRYRKPTHLKALQGTLRPDRTNPDEPKLNVGLPRPPTWLRASAVEHYERIGAQAVAMRVMTSADAEALALLADAHQRYLQASDEVAARGFMIQTKGTRGGEIVKLNPAFRAQADLWKRIMQGLVSFEMTPHSRPGVSAIRPEPEATGLDKFR